MTLDHVTVRGERHYVIDGRLDLRQKEITDIKKIEGLELLINLQELVLSGNQIKEIKGLDKLTNLRKLDLDGNQIREIKGLENRINLQYVSRTIIQ